MQAGTHLTILERDIAAANCQVLEAHTIQANEQGCTHLIIQATLTARGLNKDNGHKERSTSKGGRSKLSSSDKQ